MFQLSMVEVKLSAAEEERDTYKQDLSDTQLSKDQVVKKAWETRDAAVKRKNASEVELAKERISVMQVNKPTAFQLAKGTTCHAARGSRICGEAPPG